MTSLASETEQLPSVELYVRSLSPTGAQETQEAVLERLDVLAQNSAIRDYSVHVWGKQVDREGTTPADRSVLERVEVFEEWSERAGATLPSFYETREASSLFAQETNTRLVLPMVCLAEYRDDELRHVAPCVEDGAACTVEDRLDTLTRGTNGSQ